MDLAGFELPEELVKKIVPHLAEDIPLVYSVPMISSEEYWKRVGKRRDPSMELRNRERTWKQLVMERIVEETLEKDMPLNPELVRRALQGLSEVIKDYVRCVSIRQLRSHISPEVLTSCFPSLTSLSLSYGYACCCGGRDVQHKREPEFHLNNAQWIVLNACLKTAECWGKEWVLIWACVEFEILIV
jgi:hypothetical protein